MKISIIVPVYNVEKYLDQCIQSIIQQTYEDLDIILVDDGSKDQSSTICDQYAVNDQRIKVIHQINKGVSLARNIGLEKATGEYILFVDGDDYYDDLYAIDKLVKSIKKDQVDVLNFQFKKYYEQERSIEKYIGSFNINEFNETTNIIDRKKYLVGNSLYTSSPCTKLIKREFLLNNNIFFEEGIKSEDIEWSMKILILSTNISVIDSDFYIYRQRENSSTHTVNDNHIQDLLDILNKCELMIKNNENIEIKEVYNNFLSFQYGTMLINAHYASKNMKKYCYKKLKDYSYLLDYHYHKKIKMLYIIKKIFGFKILYGITYIYSKVR